MLGWYGGESAANTPGISGRTRAPRQGCKDPWQLIRVSLGHPANYGLIEGGEGQPLFPDPFACSRPLGVWPRNRSQNVQGAPFNGALTSREVQAASSDG